MLDPINRDAIWCPNNKVTPSSLCDGHNFRFSLSCPSLSVQKFFLLLHASMGMSSREAYGHLYSTTPLGSAEL